MRLSGATSEVEVPRGERPPSPVDDSGARCVWYIQRPGRFFSQAERLDFCCCVQHATALDISPSLPGPGKPRSEQRYISPPPPLDPPQPRQPDRPGTMDLDKRLEEMASRTLWPLSPHQQMCLGVSWSLVCLSGIFLGLRFYCKVHRHKKLWWDDWSLLFSWVGPKETNRRSLPRSNTISPRSSSSP